MGMPNDEKKADFSVKFNWPIIGHKNILWYLQHSILKGQLNHAYLFSGPRSVGKTTVAECFISSLLCKAAHHGEGEKVNFFPCKQCVSCQQFFKQLHPDIYWVKVETNEKSGAEKKNISIEQMRELQSKLSKRSFLNSYKVAIISDAELMTLEAANSLLKTLEEPATGTIIILITSDITKIPQTIVSRCQALKFLPVSIAEVTNYLIKEGVERKKAQIFSELSLGRPGVAFRMLEEEQVLVDYQKEVRSFIELANLTLTERFNTLTEFFSIGTSFISQIRLLDQKLNIWLSVVRDLILLKNSSESYIKNSFVKDELKKMALSVSNKKLLNTAKNLEMTKKYLSLNINPRLSLENLLINL